MEDRARGVDRQSCSRARIKEHLHEFASAGRFFSQSPRR